MIEKITVESFKSLQSVTVDLGIVNVFIGANGSGKSNLLESIGVLSAAADGKVNDQTLLQRGVRPGVPQLYKSAFASDGARQSPHIYFDAASKETSYMVSLNNPLNDPSPAWKFQHESLDHRGQVLTSRSPNMRQRPNPEVSLAALKAAEWPDRNGPREFLEALQSYVIFAPTTPVLRGVQPESQPRLPLGASGGRIPEAVKELLEASRDSDEIANICVDALGLIHWAKSFGTVESLTMPLSPSAAASPRVIRFEDRFMKKGRNVLSGYDASEGALYVLFLAVLAGHPRTPRFFAVDNADHGLNPRLARDLMARFSDWMLARPVQSQALLTTHNPAALDGLPLSDDRVRLFTVDRDHKGRTVVRRIELNDKMKKYAAEGWTLSRLWMNGLIGGMPNV